MLGESSHFTDFINLDAQVKWQEGLEDHLAPRIPKSLALHPPQRRINTDATLVLQCCCPSTCLIIMQGGYQNSFSFFIEMSNNAAFSGKLRRVSCEGWKLQIQMKPRKFFKQLIHTRSTSTPTTSLTHGSLKPVNLTIHRRKHWIAIFQLETNWIYSTAVAAHGQPVKKGCNRQIWHGSNGMNQKNVTQMVP